MMLRSGRNKAQFAALLVPGIIVFALFTVYPIVKQIMEATGEDVRLVLRYTPLHEGSD